MPSDFFRIAGHTITSFELLCLGAFLLGVAALLLAFALERKTALRRSVVTDDLTNELARVAQALDRIAEQGSYRIVRSAAEDAARARAANAAAVEGKEAEAARAPNAPAAANTEANVVPEPPPPQRRIAYSIFGR
jgi:hypothetical protein